MIYICIPSYNEERTVGVLLWKIRQVMAEFPRDYHLLVLDDASTDGTSEILAPYTRVLPLTVIRHTERKGYAASLETLLREAVRRAAYPRRDVIVTLQADFTEEPERIPTLVKRIEGGVDVATSVVTGAPKAPLQRWMRRTVGYLLRRFDWPDPVSDPLSGFRAYRVICVRRALEARNGRPLLRWEGWAANAELLQAVRPYARRMAETPVPLRDDRRGRDTRFRFWETARHLSGFLRVGPEPAPAGGAPSNVDGARTSDGRARPTGGRSGGHRRGDAGGDEPTTADAVRGGGLQGRRSGRGGRRRRGQRPESKAGGEG